MPTPCIRLCLTLQEMLLQVWRSLLSFKELNLVSDIVNILPSVLIAETDCNWKRRRGCRGSQGTQQKKKELLKFSVAQTEVTKSRQAASWGLPRFGSCPQCNSEGLEASKLQQLSAIISCVPTPHPCSRWLGCNNQGCCQLTGQQVSCSLLHTLWHLEVALEVFGLKYVRPY